MELDVLLEVAHQYGSGRTGSALCPYEPNSDMQRKFVESDVFELLTGGGTGGGKTFALLMSALRYAHTPGYKALILRRTFKSLEAPDGPVWLANQWLRNNPRCTWVAGKRQWIIQTGGEPAVLQFGHCQYDSDIQGHMGPSWTFLGIDEIGEFATPHVWTTFKTRFRKPRGSTIPMRMRCTGNPGGPGQSWLYEYFVKGGGDKYIRSTYKDNAHIDQEEYRKILDSLDEVSRRYYLDGDWLAKRTGRIYPIDERHMSDGMDCVGTGWNHVLGLDLGSSAIRKTTAFCVMSWHDYIPQQMWVRECFTRAYTDPYETRDEISRLCDKYDDLAMVVDPGALGKGWIAVFRKRFGEAVRAVEKYPGYKLTARTFLASALDHDEMQFDRAGCADLVKEADLLVWDESGTDNEKGVDNHATDALLYAYLHVRAYLSDEYVVPPSTEAEIAEHEERKMWDFASPANEDEDEGDW